MGAVFDYALYGPSHPHAHHWVALTRLVAYAKAAKHDTDPADEMATIVAKVIKKARREDCVQHLQDVEALTYAAPEPLP